jgi:TetR/AcrR family transcriptional regulator
MDYIAERRLEEKDRRRSEILDAAEAVAANEGIDALTMDQVARRARISRALLYVYFADKADLHLGLCERGLEVLKTRFENAAAQHRTGLAQLEAMGRAYVEFSKEFPVYFEAMARFQASESEGVEDGDKNHMGACLAAGECVHRIMVESVQAGVRDQSISAPAAANPIAVAMTLWGLMHGTILLTTTKTHVLSKYGLTGASLVEQSIQLAVRGLGSVQ